jgi:hypothetical protein
MRLIHLTALLGVCLSASAQEALVPEAADLVERSAHEAEHEDAANLEARIDAAGKQPAGMFWDDEHPRNPKLGGSPTNNGPNPPIVNGGVKNPGARPGKGKPQNQGKPNGNNGWGAGKPNQGKPNSQNGWNQGKPNQGKPNGQNMGHPTKPGQAKPKPNHGKPAGQNNGGNWPQNGQASPARIQVAWRMVSQEMASQLATCKTIMALVGPISHLR